MNDFDPATLGAVELHPFERGRRSLLAAPLPVGPGVQVVLELFDKPAPGFTDADRRTLAAAAVVGADLLRQALAERQTHRLLFDAVEAALSATDQIAGALGETPDGVEDAPPRAALDRLTQGLDADANAVVDAKTTVELIEAIRGLAVRHGPAAVGHCVRQVQDLRRLLDGMA